MAEGTFLGLRSAIYQVADLQAAKAWYTELLGFGPYFDEPFYVGFEVGGYELGLHPDTSIIQPGPGGAVPYWGVASADNAFARVIEMGAVEVEPVSDVGGGIRTAIVKDPFGNLLALIENPNFKGGN
jgi:predicted enzyme related to lactoylglutathione lyase